MSPGQGESSLGRSLDSVWKLGYMLLLHLMSIILPLHPLLMSAFSLSFPPSSPPLLSSPSSLPSPTLLLLLYRILRALLGELIRRTVTQSYPKLLLRRTESVAERMLTNWLTFCLHGYIMVSEGREGWEKGKGSDQGW